MSDIIHALESFKDVFTIPSRIEELESEIKRFENEQNDLLHFIELGKADGKKMSQIYNDIKALRRNRRKAKDELEILKSAKEILAYPKPKDKDINRVIGNVRKIIEYHQEKRTYTMRVRTDLQEKVNG